MKFVQMLLLGAVAVSAQDVVEEGGEGGQLMGGASEWKAIVADDEMDVLFRGAKAQIEAAAGDNITYTTFKPLKYTSQVVAGTIYQVLIEIDGDEEGEKEIINVKITQALEVDGGALTVNTVVEYEEEAGEGAEEKVCVDCWKDFTEVTAESDAELFAYFEGLKADVETQASASFTTWKPLKFSEKAETGEKVGTTYTVVFQTGEGDLIEVKAFKATDNTTTITASQVYDEKDDDHDHDHDDDKATALFASLYMVMTVAMVAFS